MDGRIHSQDLYLGHTMDIERIKLLGAIRELKDWLDNCLQGIKDSASKASVNNYESFMECMDHINSQIKQSKELHKEIQELEKKLS